MVWGKYFLLSSTTAICLLAVRSERVIFLSAGQAGRSAKPLCTLRTIGSYPQSTGTEGGRKEGREEAYLKQTDSSNKLQRVVRGNGVLFT